MARRAALITSLVSFDVKQALFFEAKQHPDYGKLGGKKYGLSTLVAEILMKHVCRCLTKAGTEFKYRDPHCPAHGDYTSE